MNTYTVRPQDLEGISLNETDTVASVLQNIAIILSTPKQSVPLARDFGLPMQFIDKPIPVARNMMVMEITEAIREFEPRAEILNISFETDPQDPGRLIPRVEVRINNE